MNDIEIKTPTNIFFEENYLDVIKGHAREKRSILITSNGFKKRGAVDAIKNVLNNNLIYIIDDVTANPSISYIDSLFLKIKNLNIDIVIAIGGGSSLDTGKAIAKLLGNKDSLITLNEHFKKKISFKKNKKALPLIAIPTTAGTGSEITHFATVWDSIDKKKYSLIGEDLYPYISILDPSLTLTLPEEETISSSLDALSHALESIWNTNATKESLMYSKKALNLLLPALETLNTLGVENNSELRSNLLKASMYSGAAINLTRTALSHSISYPLTSFYKLPHGIACSFSLASVLKFNLVNDDGRIRNTIIDLGYDSIDQFEKKLFSLFIELGGLIIMKKYIKNLDDILGLTSKMITPERSNNNLKKANEDDIFMIVKEILQNFKK
jgi:alcohol dehydrogenase